MKSFLIMLLNEVGHPVVSYIVSLVEAELDKVLQSMTDGHPAVAKGEAYEVAPDRFIDRDAKPVATADSAVI